jgi:hypothetical protein
MSQTTKNLLSSNLHLIDESIWEILDINQLTTKTINKKNVLIMFSDHIGDNSDFLSIKSTPQQSEQLIAVIQRNPTHNFYIFCGILNFSQIEKIYPNVRIIHWTDEMFVITNCHYIDILPQREKNFNSEKHWISVSQNKRIPRYLAAMYLLGKNLDKTGLLKFDPTELLEHESWDSYVSYWKYNNREKEITQLLSYSDAFERGFYKIKNKQGYKSNQYRGATDQHHKNFDQFLKPLYKNSFIEIVIETVFLQDYGLVTEKFLNSVYGFNLPIILNVPGSIGHLRTLGFDMFDSVIDHSYDLITDPMDRLFHALDLNKTLLEDSTLARSAWRKCFPAMEHNLSLAQTIEKNLSATFTERLTQVIKEVAI